MRSDLVDLTLYVHAETERAVRVSDDGDLAKSVWLPKSQCEVDYTKQRGVAVVTMPERLATEKGLV